MRFLTIIIFTTSVFSIRSAAHPGWGIEFDSKGNLFFTDIVNKTIWKYTTSGELIEFSKNKWSHQLFIDEKDNVIICNEEFELGNGWNSVIKISPNGKEQYLILPTKYGEEFSGSLICPADDGSIIYEYKNNLYKRDLEGNHYKIYDSKNFNSISNLHYESPGKYYLVDGAEIKVFDENEKISVAAKNLLDESNNRGAYGGRYNKIYGIDVDGTGNIYAAYYGNSKVLKISPGREKAVVYLSPQNWYPVGVKKFNDSLYILEEGHAPDDGPNALRILKIDDEGNQKVIVSMGHIGGESVKLSE